MCVSSTFPFCSRLSPVIHGSLTGGGLFLRTIFILIISVQSHYPSLKVLSSLLTTLGLLVSSSPFCLPMSDSFFHSVSDGVTSV